MPVLTRGRTGALAAAGVVLAVALSPAAEGLAEARFSWHMLQHMALTLVAAPLLALARPLELGLRLLPPSAARAAVRAGRPLRRLPPGALAVAAWTAAAVTLWTWHVPALYAAALRSPGLHALEHASLLLAGTWWWSVLAHSGTRRGIDPLAALPYCFTTVLHVGALGALLAFSSTVLYVQPAAPDPLADQQLAGVLLWVPGGLLQLAPALVLLVRRLHTPPLPGAAR